jgi:biotin carboxylase
MLAVAHAAAEFAAAGIRLQVSPAVAIDLLSTKSATYELANRFDVPVPAYQLATDVGGFRRTTQLLRDDGHEVCIKPDTDFGGHGFRVLDEAADDVAALGEPPSVRVAPHVVDELLARVVDFPPLVVSEFLPGLELSVDCLSSPDGELMAALPRRKGGLEWSRELVDDAAAEEIARAMVEACGLRYLSNVQVKYPADTQRGPVLLEVNTRAASGLYQSCRAGGVNLPAAALAMVLAEPVEVPKPTYGQVMIVYNEALPYQPR